MLGILLLVAIASAQSPYDYDVRGEFSGDQRIRSAEVQPVELAVNGKGIVAVRSPILDPEVADQLEGNGWLDVIPGTPGKDYPDYEIVPQTSFTCRGRTPGGYYADVETRCQVFHVCDADGRKNSFLCPSGSIFNQKYFICDWWYDFECDDATELYSLNDKVKRGDRASGSKGPGQGHARDEIDIGCCAEAEEEGNAHGTFEGDLSLAGTGEGSIGYARRNDKIRGYQSNEKEAEEESHGGNESQGRGRDEREESRFRNVKSRRTNQFATDGFAGDHRTAGNNNARGGKVEVGATLELKSRTPERSRNEDEIRGNFRPDRLETARESLQPREAVEYAGGNDNYSDYGTHQDRRLTTSRHSSGPRGEKIEHLDNLQPNLERSRSADNRMLDAGQDSSFSWSSSGSGHEKFNDRRSFPRNRDNERFFREEKTTSSYRDSSRLNYDESERLDDSKSGSLEYRRETRRQNLADANDPGTFHRPQTSSELVTSSSRVNPQKSSFATSSRHANNAVSDRGANSSSSSTVSTARSSHSDSFDQLSTDIRSQASDSQYSSPDLKKYSEAEKTSAQYFGKPVIDNNQSSFALSSNSNQQRIADSPKTDPNSRHAITKQAVYDHQSNVAKISIPVDSNSEKSPHLQTSDEENVEKKRTAEARQSISYASDPAAKSSQQKPIAYDEDSKNVPDWYFRFDSTQSPLSSPRSSEQSSRFKAAHEKHRQDDDKETFARASSSSSRFHPQKSSRIQRTEKKIDEIDLSDHRKFGHRRVSNGRIIEGSSDGQGSTIVRRSSDDDDEIPHYDVAKIDDFVRRNVGAATNDREFNFTEYPRPSHPRYPSRSNEEEFFPSGVISQDSKQSEDKGASGIKRFNSTVGSPSSASGPRANVKESSHSTATEEISRRNNGQSRQRTSEGLQNGLGNGYPSAGRGRELPGSAVIAATIAPGTVYGSSVEKSSTISQARESSFGTRTPGMITDARSRVTRIGDLDAFDNSARYFQNDDHFRNNFTNRRATLYERPSGTSDFPDRERKSERFSGTKRVNGTSGKKSSRLVGKTVEGLYSFPRRSTHEDNDYPMKLRFLPLL